MVVLLQNFLCYISSHFLELNQGNRCQLITKSPLPNWTEPAVLVAEVAKQHDVFARAITFGVFASTLVRFCLDKVSRKLLEYLNEDLPRLALVSPAALRPKSAIYTSIKATRRASSPQQYGSSRGHISRIQWRWSRKLVSIFAPSTLRCRKQFK